MGRSLRERGATKSLVALPTAEQWLSTRDAMLARLIASQSARWPTKPTEYPVWGLIRIVMAQQVSTQMAYRVAERLKSAQPTLTTSSPTSAPHIATLRSIGISERRAQCCIAILQQSGEILAKVQKGGTWEQALAGVKGIGPWTVSVFRIMVLRDPDVLPIGDIALSRAITQAYGRPRNVELLGKTWRPFRSVACWYLWRSLGNKQLG